MSATHKNKLDQEWILLLQTAKMMGISADEVRQFLNQSITQQQVSNSFRTERIHGSTSEILIT